MSFQSIWGDIFSQKKEISNQDILKKVTLFQGLNLFDFNILNKFIHLRQFQDNEVVFYQNEPGESLYVVKSGRVLISDSLKRHETEMTQYSFFGELSLVDENPRLVTATTLEQSELLVLFRSDLLKIKSDYPALASKIFYNLSFILGKRLSLIYSESSPQT